jgi:hypothetical protein
MPYLLNLLKILIVLVPILAAVRVWHMFRARAMRTLAANRGFQYIGPGAPKWWNPSHPRLSPPLPGQVAHDFASLRQVWNVIEGRQNGVSVFIFDSVMGWYGKGGGATCTFIACHGEPSPFGIGTSRDFVIQSHGWTVLHGRLLWLPWPISVKRLDSYLKNLRVGACEPSCR